MTLALLAAIALFISPSDTLTGRVTDAAGHPLAHATVRLPQLRRLAETDQSGRFVFAGIPDGRWSVSVTDVGFAPQLRQVEVTGGGRLEVVLEPSAVELPALLVTASPNPSDQFGTPLATSTLEADLLRRNQSVAIARATEALPGVRSVTTGSQIAKPMIRGLSGQRVLVLDGGHRLEDYSWSDEDGPSLDARLAGRVELIRGPTSLLYGADAIGGVVNAIPDALPEAGPDGRSWHRTSLELSVATNNAESGTTLRYQRGTSGSGFRATVVGRRAAALHTPDGELENTGFGAVNGEIAYGLRGAKGSVTFRGSHYGGEFRLLEADGPPAIRSRSAAEEEEEGPARKSRDERVQIDALRFTGPWRVEFNGQFQQHSLVEVSDDATPSTGSGRETVAFDLLLNTVTLGLTAHRQLGEHLLATLGASALRQTSDTRGPIALVPAGTNTTLALFGVAEQRFPGWSLLAGIRGDGSSLDATANSALSFSGSSRRYHAMTGDLGVIVRVTDGVALSANAGRGWRAPNLFELFSNGPKLSEARYEMGEATLKIEVGTNVEASLRWQRPHLRGEVTGYRHDVDNFIHIAPTGQVLGGLAVYHYQQVDARLTGAEASLEVDPFPAFTLRARVDGVRARERVSGDPLPLIPPMRTVVGAEWHNHAFGWAGVAHVGVDLIGVARQKDLAAYDVGTAGYSLIEFTAGFDRAALGHSLAVELSVHNVTNASYRDFLSRYKAFALNPGRDIVLRASMDL